MEDRASKRSIVVAAIVALLCALALSMAMGPTVAHAVFVCSSHVLSYVELKEATCTENGNIAYYECTNCGQFFTASTETDDQGNVTTTYTDVTEEDVTVAATGHDYDYENITWEWSEDYSSATATVVCKNDSSHTLTVDAEITTSTTDATCEEDGSTEYTASITVGETTYTNVTEDDVTVAATGHDYDGGVVTVEAWDGAEGTITYTCANNSSHTYTETFLYYIEEGADQTIGRGEDLAVTSETDNTALGTAYAKFTGLQVDGADLDSSDYTYEEGSVVATISAAYLDTLDAGEHELTFVYEDGSVSTTFTIEDEEESSDDGLAGTGDRTAFTVLSIATMGGIAIVAGILAAKRRKA